MPTQIFDHSIRNIWCTLTFLLFLANNWVHYSDNKGGRLLLRRTTAAIFAPRQHDRTCAFHGLYARRHSPRVGLLVVFVLLCFLRGGSLGSAQLERPGNRPVVAAAAVAALAAADVYCVSLGGSQMSSACGGRLLILGVHPGSSSSTLRAPCTSTTTPEH